MTIVPDNERCEEQVHDGGRAVSFHRCRNRAKGEHDGKRLCGQHLAKIERRRAKREAWDRQEREDDAFRARLERLRKKHGLNLKTYYHLSSGRMSHTHVVVGLDELLKLLDET